MWKDIFGKLGNKSWFFCHCQGSGHALLGYKSAVVFSSNEDVVIDSD